MHSNLTSTGCRKVNNQACAWYIEEIWKYSNEWFVVALSWLWEDVTGGQIQVVLPSIASILEGQLSGLWASIEQAHSHGACRS